MGSPLGPHLLPLLALVFEMDRKRGEKPCQSPGIEETGPVMDAGSGTEEESLGRKALQREDPGDFNIVPEDRDAYDPVALRGQIFLSPPEREALARIMNLGFRDAFRALHPDPGHFSWWDYRQGMFRRNMGLRIDLILMASSLEPALTSAEIDREVRKNERPSDHAPVFVDFDDSHLG